MMARATRRSARTSGWCSDEWFGAPTSGARAGLHAQIAVTRTACNVSSPRRRRLCRPAPQSRSLRRRQWGVMAIDSDALVALLPHRPPFRFVDAIDALEPGVSVRGRYRVTGDELVTTVELERLSARGGWGQGKATVDGGVACEARLFFALAPGEA